MVEPKSSRRNVFRAYVREHLASILAILVSVVSLGVALSSNRTQERLLAASAWPTLEFGTGNRSDSGTDEITLVLGNNGVGPARLRGVRVFYKGEFAADSRRLMQRCCAAGDSPFIAVTSGTRGRVLKAGDRIVLMTLPTDTQQRRAVAASGPCARRRHRAGVLLLGAGRLLDLRLHAHGSGARAILPRALGRRGMERLKYGRDQFSGAAASIG